jgi:hypothetical protein
MHHGVVVVHFFDNKKAGCRFIKGGGREWLACVY